MPDVHDIKTRSYNMSRIKGANTKPEMKVRKFLFAKGLRYRLHQTKLPGKPDLVFPKFKKVIFVNGCFWHGHQGCNLFKLPITRHEWWKDKIRQTQERDNKNYKLLKKYGWKVLIVWECDLKSKKLEKTMNKIYSSLIKLRN